MGARKEGDVDKEGLENECTDLRQQLDEQIRIKDH